MRPATVLMILVALILAADLLLFLACMERRNQHGASSRLMADLVQSYGLSDLAVATEARYTRHPAVSDPVVPFMDHPGALEHFPTGSFWRPVQP